MSTNIRASSANLLAPIALKSQMPLRTDLAESIVGYRTIMFWHLDEKKQKNGVQGDMRSKVPKHGDSYKSAVWDKDGKCYTAGYDGSIWTWTNGTMSKKTEASKSLIHGMAYNNAKHMLLTGGKDGVMKAWKIDGDNLTEVH